MERLFDYYLPCELLTQIIEHIASDKTSLYHTLSTLRNCRTVSSALNEIVTPLLYRQVPFNGPHSFAKFLSELRQYPERGKLVRTLDFSACTSVGLGRSRSCNTRIELLTAKTLNECLELCPNVEELFLSEALDNDIDATLLSTIFLKLKSLQALDFCAADTPEFCYAFQEFIIQHPTWQSTISNLSFHNCSTLSPWMLESLLPHFVNLKRLDLYNTQATDRALLSLPSSCNLTLLNLSQCALLTAAALLEFISSHPASRSLKSLSLLYSWNRTHPFSKEPQALDAFIQCLPRDMQVLDLAGLELDMQHILSMPPSLIELGAHDIDVSQSVTHEQGIGSAQEVVYPVILPKLQYLLLTHHVISSEVKFASILTMIFPNLAILESPGFKRLHLVNSSTYEKISGTGRRDWIQRLGLDASRIEAHARQWHPRKSNMSLTSGTPRGIYDYYSYRV